MEEKKNSKITLYVLCVIIVCMAGFLTYTLSNNNTSTERKSNSQDNLTNNVDESNSKCEEKICEEQSCPKCPNSSDSNVSKVVNTPTYNKLTRDIAKDLVGKYVSEKNKDIYFEIKSNGKITFQSAVCVGLNKQENLEFYAYYEKYDNGDNTFGHRTYLTFISTSGIITNDGLSVNLEALHDYSDFKKHLKIFKVPYTDLACGEDVGLFIKQ